MTDTVTRPADELAIALEDRTRLFHWYFPYSPLGTGPPPAGAKALCGHRREPTATGEVRYFGDPLACAVCTELREGFIR